MNEYGTLIITTIAIVGAGALVFFGSYLLRPRQLNRRQWNPSNNVVREILDLIATTPPNVKIRAVLRDGTVVESFPNPFGIEYEPEWVDVGYSEDGWTFGDIQSLDDHANLLAEAEEWRCRSYIGNGGSYGDSIGRRREGIYWCVTHDQPSEPWRGACLTVDDPNGGVDCVIEHVPLEAAE